MTRMSQIQSSTEDVELGSNVWVPTPSPNPALHIPDELTPVQIKRKRWKYLGYKEYTKFIGSDADFLIVRRFSTLNARVLLSLQDQLSVLEEDLDVLDTNYSRKSASDVHNGSFRQDQEDREELISEILGKLKEYSEFAAQIHSNSSTDETTDDFVLQLSELAKQPPAPARNVRSLKRWFHNNDEAIHTDERKYIDNKRDLWALVPREKTPLRRLLERSGRFRTFALWRQPEEERPIHDKYITYTSDKRIDRFVTIIIVAVGTIMLVAPLWILSVINPTKVKLGIITGFIALFLGLMTAATNARPFETLGATAA